MSDAAGRGLPRGPATIRSVVVLPQPDGPSRAKNDPRRHREVELVDGDEVAERAW